MKLTKDQINHWVEKGFTSGKDSIVYIRIKTAYAGPGTVFRTFVEGLTSMGVPIPESLTELKTGDKCSVSLDDTYMVIGSGIFKVPYDKLFVMTAKKPELKKEIAELTFVPYVDTSTKYDMLNYSILSQEGVFKLDPPTSVLCPPCANCIPPYPRGCRDNKIDTSAAD